MWASEAQKQLPVLRKQLAQTKIWRMLHKFI